MTPLDQSGQALFSWAKGAAVKVMDSSIICHPEVVAKLEGLAQVQGISVQRDIMRGGGTDAGAIHTPAWG